MMCHAGFGGVDPETNEYYCFLETFAGGYGGRDGSDGPDAVQTHGQNTENAPVEETELNYPVRVARLSLVDDSDGAGRYRGGLGLRKDFVFDRATTFTVLADRTVAGPAGAFGGLPGKTAGVRAHPRRHGEAGSARRRRSTSSRGTRSASAPAAAAATGRRRSATASSSRETCARARSASSAPGRCTGGGRLR